MTHPKNHFGLFWFTLSLASSEFFIFRIDPAIGGWFVTSLWGFPFMFVTFLPALFISVLIYAAVGWLD